MDHGFKELIPFQQSASLNSCSLFNPPKYAFFFDIKMLKVFLLTTCVIKSGRLYHLGLSQFSDHTEFWTSAWFLSLHPKETLGWHLSAVHTLASFPTSVQSYTHRHT